jgi:serine/threonine protein kinase
MMTEAINNPTSLQIIFKEGFENQTDDNLSRMGIALGATTELYEFIKYIGMKYGFMHNDLHMGNILFNPDTNRLVLIDFGRASFKMLIDRIESTINNFGMNEFYKLSYDKLFRNVNIDYYVDLYGNKQLYKHHISIGTEGKYFGVIYDLITYTMNIYVYYHYFIKNHAEPEFEEFNNNFSKIITLHYTTDLRLLIRKIDISSVSDIKTLVENYVQVRDYYIRPLTEPILKNFYTFLLEGLFYTALFMNFMDVPNRRLYVFSNDYFFRAFQITVYDKLPEFKEYIERELRFYRSELETDTFLSAFIPVLGGRYEQSMVLSKPIHNKHKVSSLKSLKSLKSPSQKSKVTLEETIEAYSNIYKDKEKLSIPHNYFEKSKSLSLKSKSSSRSSK